MHCVLILRRIDKFIYKTCFIRNVTRFSLMFLSLLCCSTNNVRNPDCTTRRGIIIGIGWRPDYCSLRDSCRFIALDRKLSRDFLFLLYITYFYFRLKDTAETMPLHWTSQLHYPPSFNRSWHTRLETQNTDETFEVSTCDGPREKGRKLLLDIRLISIICSFMH